MSYSSGWVGEFAFIVDSDKIFISPTIYDKIYYGIIPDSIFYQIDSIFLRIIKDSSIKSHMENIADCSYISIIAIANNDTIRIRQQCDVSKEFWPLIHSFETFLKKGKLKSIRNWPARLETSKIFSVTQRLTMRGKNKKSKK